MTETKAEAAATINKKKHAEHPLAQRTGGRITPAHAPEQTALHRSYGEIGISAVAAAARYQGAAKNPAYAPAPIKPHDRGRETVA